MRQEVDPAANGKGCADVGEEGAPGHHDDGLCGEPFGLCPVIFVPIIAAQGHQPQTGTCTGKTPPEFFLRLIPAYEIHSVPLCKGISYTLTSHAHGDQTGYRHGSIEIVVSENESRETIIRIILVSDPFKFEREEAGL